MDQKRLFHVKQPFLFFTKPASLKLKFIRQLEPSINVLND